MEIKKVNPLVGSLFCEVGCGGHLVSYFRKTDDILICLDIRYVIWIES